MCGGRGSRMGRLTSKIPKPLIEINNKPILEYKINNYYKQKYKNITIAVGYKHDLVKAKVQSFDIEENMNIKFSNAGEKAGILERLRFASENKKGPILVTYGDTITNIDINKLFEAHENSDNLATIVVASILNPFGLIKFDLNNQITSFDEKPLLNYFIGYFIINSNYINDLDSNTISMNDGKGIVKVFQDLICINKLGSFFYDGDKITFNTPSELELAKNKIINFYTSKEV